MNATASVSHDGGCGPGFVTHSPLVDAETERGFSAVQGTGISAAALRLDRFAFVGTMDAGDRDIRQRWILRRNARPIDVRSAAGPAAVGPHRPSGSGPPLGPSAMAAPRGTCGN